MYCTARKYRPPAYCSVDLRYLYAVHARTLAQVNALPEKAHLLGDVLQNLAADPDYYAKRTLQYSVKTDDPLYQRLKPLLPADDEFDEDLA